jgi:hypothetical protein
MAADYSQLAVLQPFVNAHDWVWPVCEMIHYVGMSLVIGIIGTLDLRVLGLFRGLPIGALRPLIPWAVVGFAGNVLTGFIFVSGTNQGPGFYLDNLSFRLKLLFLLLAFLNLVVFRFTGLEERVYATPAGGSAPLAAKGIAAFSLFAWVLIIFFGRMLMYNDTLLMFLGM